jgi:hypothetical protein
VIPLSCVFNYWFCLYEILNFIFLGLTKLLVYHSDGLSNSFEIVNLDETNPDLSCDNLPSFAVSVSTATGKLYQGTTPIICGGFKSTYRCECQSFKNGAWQPEASLNTCRGHPQSVVFKNPSKQNDDILMISGGTDLANINSLVESYDGKSWDQRRIATMPELVPQHCLVKINDSMLMSIGGIEALTSWTPKTYFLDINKNIWMEGPPIITPRAQHSCAIMNWKNPNTGKLEKVVVVAGGRERYGDDLNSVELLFLENYKNGFNPGPTLPLRVWYLSLVEFRSGVILVGGQYKNGTLNQNLYELLSPTAAWTKMKQTLKGKPACDVAFLIPDDLVSCH